VLVHLQMESSTVTPASQKMSPTHVLTHAVELIPGTRFEVFTALKIQVEVIWVVMPFSVVVGHQHYEGP
jgi:hypothetical protein